MDIYSIAEFSYKHLYRIIIGITGGLTFMLYFKNFRPEYKTKLLQTMQLMGTIYIRNIHTSIFHTGNISCPILKLRQFEFFSFQFYSLATHINHRFNRLCIHHQTDLQITNRSVFALWKTPQKHILQTHINLIHIAALWRKFVTPLTRHFL